MCRQRAGKRERARGGVKWGGKVVAAGCRTSVTSEDVGPLVNVNITMQCHVADQSWSSRALVWGEPRGGKRLWMTGEHDVITRCSRRAAGSRQMRAAGIARRCGSNLSNTLFWMFLPDWWKGGDLPRLAPPRPHVVRTTALILAATVTLEPSAHRPGSHQN